MRVDPDTAEKAGRLAREIASIVRSGLALPGTLTHRHTRCGRPGCKCSGDPPQLHGPYWSWTRKVDQKTITRYLSDQQYEDYRSYFDNVRKLKALFAEFEAISLAAVDDDPRWQRQGRPRSNPSS